MLQCNNRAVGLCRLVGAKSPVRVRALSLAIVMSTAIFPPPDHDHGRCAAEAIAHPEALCAARAQRLTPTRRQVLEALLTSHKPLGAYEIIDRAAPGARPAPITVYRALDFLIENGLVHRLESLNAFIACVNKHEGGDL